jgi:hypothetical protein
MWTVLKRPRDADGAADICGTSIARHVNPLTSAQNAPAVTKECLGQEFDTFKLT